MGPKSFKSSGPGKSAPDRQAKPRRSLAAVFASNGPDAGARDLPSSTLQALGFQLLWECKQARASIGLVNLQAIPGLAGQKAVAIDGIGSEGACCVPANLPAGLRSASGAKLRGIAKSAEMAYMDLANTSSDTCQRWGLALNFALHGFAAKQAVRAEMSRALEEQLCSNIRIVELADVLVWQGFIEFAADQLASAVSIRRKRNPLVDHIGLAEAAELPAVTSQEVARPVITELGRRDGFEPGVLFGRTVAMICGNSPSGEFADNQAGDFKEIMGMYFEGNGIGRPQLEDKYASSLHVVANMFDARWLVESPDGYVFCRQELEGFLRELRLKQGSHPPGTRKIKDTLGLQRTKAEGLQALLGEWHEAESQFDLTGEAG